MWYTIERAKDHLPGTDNPLAQVYEFDSLGGAVKKLRELEAAGRPSVIAKGTQFAQAPAKPGLAWRLNHADLFPVSQKGHVFLWQRANNDADERELTPEETDRLGVHEGYIDWHPEGRAFGYVAWVFSKPNEDDRIEGAFYDHQDNCWV